MHCFCLIRDSVGALTSSLIAVYITEPSKNEIIADLKTYINMPSFKKLNKNAEYTIKDYTKYLSIDNETIFAVGKFGDDLETPELNEGFLAQVYKVPVHYILGANMDEAERVTLV